MTCIAEHFTDWQPRSDTDQVALSLQSSAELDSVSLSLSFRWNGDSTPFLSLHF